MTENRENLKQRTSGFARNATLEVLLKEINQLLWIPERSLLENYSIPSHPLILLMGPMRSGTTLMMQWLANSGGISYPTNLLSRFYQAPILGAKIQLLLTDPRYAFREELSGLAQQVDYSSTNGKTKGVLAPNEFWYFWRRFLSDSSRDVWSDAELRDHLDAKTMLAEVSGMMDVFQKPFAAKGLLFNYNIPFLDRLFPKILFVHIKRDPIHNVASVLEARKRQLGDESKWYSFKIPEYDQLIHLSPVEQVAGQVHFMNCAVERGLASVDESRKLYVSHEAFCRDPKTVFHQLMEKIGLSSVEYTGVAGFSLTRKDTSDRYSEIKRAVEKFANLPAGERGPG
jgi:hypothetical protein